MGADVLHSKFSKGKIGSDMLTSGVPLWLKFSSLETFAAILVHHM